MITLPSFKNYNVCNFMIGLTSDCVEMYKIDVAYDISTLYRLMLNGNYKSIYWGVRECGTGMGYEDSEILEYYKDSNMIVIFEFSNLRIDNGNVMGDIAMISYQEPYTNKLYNDCSEENFYYHAQDDYDEFYNEVRKITRKFLRDSNI